MLFLNVQQSSRLKKFELYQQISLIRMFLELLATKFDLKAF